MMSITRRKYTREFKLEAVRLLESSGRSAAQIERELGIGDGCLLQWRKRFASEGVASRSVDDSGVSEREQIRQLKRENEILRQEREILKKAVAIFSQPRP
jgi:transposase